jgi:hypothetical protein
MVVIKPRALATLAGATSLSFLLTASPAVADLPQEVVLEARITNSGEIVARGAAVDIPLEIRCNTSEYLYISVSATEMSGRNLASGSSGVRSLKVACDGGPASLKVRVKSQDEPFHTGTADVSLYMLGCAPGTDDPDNWICGDKTNDLKVLFER